MKKSWEIDIYRNSGHDYQRYLKKFFKLFRRAKEIKFKPIKNFYRLLFRIHAKKHSIEIYTSTDIGLGLAMWHPFNITIALESKLGNNCTLNKNVLIGREFRGSRKGCPTIGNNVWIGANAVIVGKIAIGDDVLIAPNSFVNCDIPSHSIVFGNPCIIKHKENATEYYIQNINHNEDLK